MKSGFLTAYEKGSMFVSRRAANYENIEEVLFDAMKENPYKSAKSQKDFLEGATQRVNALARRRTSRQIYG
jgi:hypothetical protein